MLGNESNKALNQGDVPEEKKELQEKSLNQLVTISQEHVQGQNPSPSWQVVTVTGGNETGEVKQQEDLKQVQQNNILPEPLVQESQNNQPSGVVQNQQTAAKETESEKKVPQVDSDRNQEQNQNQSQALQNFIFDGEKSKLDKTLILGPTETDQKKPENSSLIYEPNIYDEIIEKNNWNEKYGVYMKEPQEVARQQNNSETKPTLFETNEGKPRVEKFEKSSFRNFNKNSRLIPYQSSSQAKKTSKIDILNRPSLERGEEPNCRIQ